jgi:hypothetical protein
MNAVNMETASSGRPRQSRPAKVCRATRWPAPKQSYAAQPGKPLVGSRSWIEQAKTSSFGHGTPLGLSIAKSADLANGSATQHSAKHCAQSAWRSIGRP